ncbi:MAG TPA: CGNR zinc finger domain-containing protein [Herbaspirillum sp.]
MRGRFHARFQGTCRHDAGRLAAHGAGAKRSGRCRRTLDCNSVRDRTNRHIRRWCSMATCRNRYKAANFRRRQRDEA